MSLINYTVEELQEELKKRKEEEEAQPTLIPFIGMDSICFVKLKNMAQGYINYLATDNGDLYQKDIKDYVFEGVMMLFFGNDVFEWINKRI